MNRKLKYKQSILSPRNSRYFPPARESADDVVFSSCVYASRDHWLDDVCVVILSPRAARHRRGVDTRLLASSEGRPRAYDYLL